jgi:hypothetical protein
MDMMYSNVLSGQSLDIVGKIIQAIEYDDQGNKIGFIEGKVDNVRFSNGFPVLMVGNKMVLPAHIMNVSEKPMLIGAQITAMAGAANEADRLRTGTITDIKVMAGKFYAVLEVEEKEEREDENGEPFTVTVKKKFDVHIEDLDELIQGIRSVGGKVRTLLGDGIVLSMYVNNQGQVIMRVDLGGTDTANVEIKFSDLKLL